MKFNYNWFSIVALLIFILGFFVPRNFVITLTILVLSIIISILGIIKANKIKPKKGIILSIIVLILSLFMIVGTPILTFINTLDKQVRVTYSQLNDIEKIALTGVQNIYYKSGDTLGDKGYVKIDSIYYEEKTDTDKVYYLIYINYFDNYNNKKKCYEHNSNNKSFIRNNEYEEWHILGEQLNEERIISSYFSYLGK